MRFIKKNKKYHELISSSLNLNLVSQNSNYGVIYTLYSNKFNSIEVGFAENNKIIEKKLLKSHLILLDKKRGKKQDLYLLVKTLNEFDSSLFNKLNFKYSKSLIRHLSTLGWPVGRSLYKPRKIKKNFSYA